MNSMNDPRRPNKIHRFKAPVADGIPQDPTSDYINAIGMVLSMCGLMLKLKWAAWMAIYCAFITFANTKSSEDTKQTLSGFMLSISAVIMSYMQNIQPMTLPF